MPAWCRSSAARQVFGSRKFPVFRWMQKVRSKFQHAARFRYAPRRSVAATPAFRLHLHAFLQLSMSTTAIAIDFVWVRLSEIRVTSSALANSLARPLKTSSGRPPGSRFTSNSRQLTP